MAQYLPIVVMAVLATVFAAVSLLMSKLMSPKNTNAAKVAPYECGIVPGRDAPERFPVHFYLVAMLFIMFDIEIIFVYPYAVAHEQLGAAGLGAIVSFSAVFFVAFVYAVAKGGLTWSPARAYRRVLTGAVSPERTATTTIRRVGLEGRDEAA